ncbi:MAG: protoporphyrinogen oxidase [Candidatus Marinimicrobia bacterium]|nr:protoporphyrinogen oxidase [Candidatus Neomarinimicrobiota bacterium]
MNKSIVIIGGGIAGLTAAFRLKEAGIKVTLLEKNDRLGGVLYSYQKDGYLAELGPNSILETSPLVTELIQDIGLEKDKVYADDSSKTRYILRNKKPLPLPSSPLSFATTPLFSIMAKLRLIKEPFISAWDNQYEESLSQFVLRRLGREFLDYAINPFVAGVYAGDPDMLSVKHGFPKLYDLEQKYGGLIKGQIKGAKERKKRQEVAKQSARMFSFRHGLKMIPDRMKDLLGSDVQTNTRVKHMTKKGAVWEVHTINSGGVEQVIPADGVLYTGRITDLQHIKIDGRIPDNVTELQQIYHPPVSVLVLGFHRDQVQHPLDGFGVLIPKVEKFQILGVLFSSTMFEQRAPKDHVTLTVFVGGVRQPENAQKSIEDILALALKDLHTILGVKGQPTFVHHTYWKQAIPQYNVGYGKYKNILNDLEVTYQGLYFSGNYRSGISVADTIVNSEEVCERIKKINRKVRKEKSQRIQ